MKRNTRIGKIAIDNNNRIFLEFNFVTLDEFLYVEEYKEKVWKLSNDERRKFHAGGVSYCY